jgi:Homeodomain-like domain
MADTPESQEPGTHPSKYARLSRRDLSALLRMHRDGLSQEQIAQHLGCTQCTVSRWLIELTDSTDVAKDYLRAQSFRMARNIVRHGKPRDHVNTLQGLEVLRQPQGAQLVVIVGGQDPITIATELVPTQTPQLTDTDD